MVKRRVIQVLAIKTCAYGQAMHTLALFIREGFLMMDLQMFFVIIDLDPFERKVQVPAGQVLVCFFHILLNLH